MAVSTGPPDLPLTLNLYGYDLVRQPAGVAVEMLVGAAAPRLARLELWGCVGWPQRLGALLQGCAHLRHFTVSFQPLIPSDGIIAAASGAGSETKAAATLQQRAAAALASGAVVTFPPLSAAATTSAVVKTIGGLHHLRSLELRGCVLNLTRRTSVDSICPGGAAVRPRTCAATKAAAERAATSAAAPSVQQLASALYQLTRLTRLAIDKINSATPLLSAVGAMHGLRHLELPDAIAPTAAELAAITRAAPRLATLTLGSVGPGSVLDAGGSAAATATAAATAAPEVLPLPPTLAVLRLARCRPTLRTMRSLQRTVEARAAAAPLPAAPAPATGAVPAAAAAAGGGPPRMGVVVSGIEIDMLDVEFDALQGFSRGSDGVMRSTLLPESAEALAAAIRLLVPPPPAASAGPQGWGAAAAADGDDDLASHKGDGGGGVSGVIPSSMAGSSTMPSFAGSGAGPGGGRCMSAFGDIGGAGGGRDVPSFGGGGAGGRFMSYFGGGGGGSGILSTFDGSVGCFDDKDIDGGGGDVGDGEGDWAPPAFGQAWTRSLVIHNAQGSLSPPAQEQQQQQVEPARHLERLPEGEVVSEPRGGSGGSSEEAADAGCVIEPSQKSVQLAPPLTGHAIWIAEMLPLGLLSLELYGVGVMEGDLEVIAELHTLRRLTLSSGELEVDALPCLAALPSLEYLELARCHPCRHRRRAGRAGFSRANGSIGVARASVGAGFSRASGGVGGAGFSRGSGGVGGGFNRGSGGFGSARVSCADSDATADADGAQADGARPTGKRALLELCLTAPRLRHVFVIRCSGMMSRAEGAEGPLGAEWVRQRLLEAGPRNRAAPAAPPPAPASGEGPGLHRSSLLGRPSWLGRPSKAVMHQVTEEELGWPQIRWD